MPKSSTNRKSTKWSEPIHWATICRAHNITGILPHGKGASHLRRKILEQIDKKNVQQIGWGLYQVKKRHA